MAIPRKGVQDIRTLSGRADGQSPSYKLYMQLCCLEMEKFRRGKERDSSMCRVNHIDARFQEIDAEKAGILEALGQRPNGSLSLTKGARGGPPRRVDGFKVRY